MEEPRVLVFPFRGLMVSLKGVSLIPGKFFGVRREYSLGVLAIVLLTDSYLLDAGKTELPALCGSVEPCNWFRPMNSLRWYIYFRPKHLLVIV